MKQNSNQQSIKDIEIWKAIPMPEYSHYEVSNLGFIRTVKMQTPIHIHINKGSYPIVKLHGIIDGKDKIRQKVFHRLLAQAFIPNPENKPEVNHINGIKSDYRLSNLEWVTSSENKVHAVSLGLMKQPCFKGEHHAMAKLTERDVLNALKMFYIINIPVRTIAKAFSIHPDMITLIVRGEYWKDVYRRFMELYSENISDHFKRKEHSKRPKLKTA